MDLPAFLFVDQPALLSSDRGSISHCQEQQEKYKKKDNICGLLFVFKFIFCISFCNGRGLRRFKLVVKKM